MKRTTRSKREIREIKNIKNKEDKKEAANATEIPENTHNTDDAVFALDIGTRSVVGVVGHISDDFFEVFDYEQRFHKKRAMRDGQIEDINLVAKTVIEIKEALEERNNISLNRVSIAAAGRSLKTMRTTFEQNINEDENITPELVHSIEFNAISDALDSFSQSDPSARGGYSCVGYDVVSYRLDGYLLSTPIGHRGTNLIIEIIAAFLPFSVVRSLYSVTSLCNLTVESLTLEPIAAINAVVPPDVRLLNIAITDIGAGTSDIGISKNGSIVAYDMVTIAGDEVTEGLMKQYLVDFSMGEAIKFKLSEESDEITFTDILGITHSCSKESVISTIDPVLENLCESIAESILKINDGSPTALFLVGGGSQVPGLCAKMAAKLNMPPERVTLGGKHPYRSITLHSDDLLTPEFVTPLGIGATSRLTHIHDLFSVTVNGEKVTMPGTENIKVIDALLLAGIKASNLIGRSPAPITYYVNGDKKMLRGMPSTPGEIFVNDVRGTIDTEVRQGDEISVVFAQNGTPATLTVSDICSSFKKTILSVTDNGEEPDINYSIQHNDEVSVIFDHNSFSELLEDEDDAEDIIENTATFESIVVEASPKTQDLASDEQKIHARTIRICVNDTWTEIPVGEGESPLFLDMLNFVDIDTKAAKGDLVLSINDHPASYTDNVHDGDRVTIKWSE